MLTLVEHSVRMLCHHPRHLCCAARALSPSVLHENVRGFFLWRSSWKHKRFGWSYLRERVHKRRSEAWAGWPFYARVVSGVNPRSSR